MFLPFLVLNYAGRSHPGNHYQLRFMYDVLFHFYFGGLGWLAELLGILYFEFSFLGVQGLGLYIL